MNIETNFVVLNAIFTEVEYDDHMIGLRKIYDHFEEKRRASDHSDDRADKQLDQICGLLERQMAGVVYEH